MMAYKNLFIKGRYAGRWHLNLGIRKGDRVLDIGAGSNPFPPSTDIVDMDSTEGELQRGGRKMPKDETRIRHIGRAEEVMPRFKDKEFDFIYSCHVLEHVENLSFLLNEMSRVGKRGVNIVPFYYFDLWLSKREAGHKWFMYYDFERNIFKIRKKLDYEYMDELADHHIHDLSDEFHQSHADTIFARAMWEFRFYWEGKIDFEIDEKMFQEMRYFNERCVR